MINTFVEIGALVSARNTDFNMKNNEMPSDGVVTGYGTVDDSLVYVYSQDASVLGGSIGEMHAKKIAKVYEMAMKIGVPVVGFIDCAGMRLQEATDALDAFGNLYAMQTMASGVIPQLTANPRNMRRRCGFDSGNDRFYIYDKSGTFICQHTKCLRRQ